MFKTVKIPTRLIERFNNEFKNERVIKKVFTVPKETIITERVLWNLLLNNRARR